MHEATLAAEQTAKIDPFYAGRCRQCGKEESVRSEDMPNWDDDE